MRPGDRCVLIGVGGLGHIGVQALTAAEVVVVDRNPDAVELASSIDADHVVIADGSHVSSVLDPTGGHGAETVIDSRPGSTSSTISWGPATTFAS